MGTAIGASRCLNRATSVVWVLIVGCGPAATSAPMTTASVITTMPPATINALAAVLNDELLHLPRDSAAFVAIGPHYADPPDELLRQLQLTHPNLKPVSKARFPKHGEMESPDCHRGAEDLQSRLRRSIYSAEMVEWLSDRKARVNVDRYGGELDGGGREETLDFQNDGTWVVHWTGRTWVY